MELFEVPYVKIVYMDMVVVVYFIFYDKIYHPYHLLFVFLFVYLFFLNMFFFIIFFITFLYLKIWSCLNRAKFVLSCVSSLPNIAYSLKLY